MIGPIVAGFAAGSVHVLAGPDHLAAVAPLAAERPRSSWLAGLTWGMGHAGGVLLVGVGALLLRGALPLDELSAWSERMVGLILIGIGAWGFRRASRQKVHAHEHEHDGHRHAHVHVHATDAGHDSPHSHDSKSAHRHVPVRAALGVGIVHGLAGSSHLLGVLPALAFPARQDAIAYVVTFGFGTVVAMTFFAAAIGWMSRRWAADGTRFYRVLLGTLSLAAVGIGAVWLLG